MPTVLGMEADYLEVPVLLGFDLGGRGVPAHALLGPSFAINLDAAIDNRVLSVGFVF